MSTLDTLATVQLCPLITFTWGSGSTARYCRWTENLTLGSETFLATPLLELQMGKQHGGAADVPVEVLLPQSLPPLDAILLWGAHAPVTVTIEELDPAAPATRRALFAGRVVQVTGNAGGRSGIAQVQVSGRKADLEVALGIVCSGNCPWIFGDGHTCGKSLTSLTITGEATAIEKNRITIAGLTNPSANYWLNGYVSRNGLNLRVRKDPGSGVLWLDLVPPAEWLHQSVTATPGCDGTPDTCLNRWNNLANFAGVGLKMPDYHPQFDAP